MKIDAQQIIESCDKYAHQHYRDGSHATDRLAYHVGLLNSKIVELCSLLENANDEIKQLQLDIIHLKGLQ